MDYKRFRDFADKSSLPLQGGKVKIDSILDKEILIVGYKIANSKYMRGNGAPQCLTLQFEFESKRFILFTGSTVLIEQISKYQEQLPFLTVIQKIDKYYSFT